jgi:hypothetical protein
MTDLNEILVTCAKLRGCYPLIHRTLHEFNWFINVVIWGWNDYRQFEMNEAIKGSPDIESVWDEIRKRETELHERFHRVYVYGDCELLNMAAAFQEYCVEEYLIKDLKDDP